ncbi:hypothetical protein B296_00010108 [Ensete ventricosum]|uniref:Uncharacterized protein n=1 Tax=Ensete ventricosum TaxID=4639 RepID=A0A427B7E3_ENSVE|nr:hypothetical protein B296_00010108 [Ensete ventricosum]
MCASSSALVEKGMELGGGRWRTLLSSIRANDDRSKIHLGWLKVPTQRPHRGGVPNIDHACARSTVIVSGQLVARELDWLSTAARELDWMSTAAWELECPSTIAQELDWLGTTAQELDWSSTTARELDWPSTNAQELD